MAAVPLSTYDSALIGPCIAWLGDHWVYRYGDEHVIKFSKIDRFRSVDDLPAFYADRLKLFQDTFGEYLLPTQLGVSDAHKRVGKIQPYVSGEQLRISHIVDVRVAEQISDIVQRLHEIQQPDEFVDCTGGGLGFFTATLGNLFILPDTSVRLIDMGMYRTQDFVTICKPLISMTIRIGRWTQQRRIQTILETVEKMDK